MAAGMPVRSRGFVTPPPLRDSSSLPKRKAGPGIESESMDVANIFFRVPVLTLQRRCKICQQKRPGVCSLKVSHKDWSTPNPPSQLRDTTWRQRILPCKRPLPPSPPPPTVQTPKPRRCRVAAHLLRCSNLEKKSRLKASGALVPTRFVLLLGPESRGAKQDAAVRQRVWQNTISRPAGVSSD